MARRAASVFSVDMLDGNADTRQPAYVRIRDRLRAAITSGALAANARLPSSRTLARDLGVGRNTVDGALDQLAEDGYVVRRAGAGTYVAPLLPERDAPPRTPPRRSSSQAAREPRLSRRAMDLARYPGRCEPAEAVPFTPSLPPIDLFPRNVWNRLLAREARRQGCELWVYGASNGLPALREAVAAHASAMRGTRCSPEQVIVVTSTQQATALAAQVLTDPGDSAWVESPGYPLAEHGLRASGLHVVRVPVDARGIDVGGGRALAPRARLAYVTPSHQYPLGYEMSMERRRALLAWAHDEDAYVLEDDYDGDYRYEGRPIASLQGMDDGGRVIYVGTFNKILFPALRVAYAIVPERLVEPFVNAKHVADGHTSSLVQSALAAFIMEGHLARHLRETRATYDERRRAFLEEASCLSGLLALGPARAGMHVSGTFTFEAGEGADEAVASACARAGVVVHPLSRYGATGRGGLVLGFAGAPRAVARSGLEIVRRAIVSVRGR